tara:strand:+ start:1635 stop:1853 length:219 start_codon:yes stop_codon:yes gene_type:complete
MREPENRTMEYCGYSKPSSEKEVQFEILGLKNLIKKAEEKISLLEQTKYLVNNSTSIKNRAKDENLYNKKSG